MDDSHESCASRIEPHQDPEGEARREFLKKVARTAATAPAVALLLSATMVPATAQAVYGGGVDPCTDPNGCSGCGS